MILVLHVPGHIHFQLVLFSKCLLVNKVGGETGSATCVEGGRDDEFFFRKGLLRHQRARQVQLSARPAFSVQKPRM